jgi:hypothetical protein
MPTLPGQTLSLTWLKPLTVAEMSVAFIVMRIILVIYGVAFLISQSCAHLTTVPQNVTVDEGKESQYSCGSNETIAVEIKVQYQNKSIVTICSGIYGKPTSCKVMRDYEGMFSTTLNFTTGIHTLTLNNTSTAFDGGAIICLGKGGLDSGDSASAFITVIKRSSSTSTEASRGQIPSDRTAASPTDQTTSTQQCSDWKDKISIIVLSAAVFVLVGVIVFCGIKYWYPHRKRQGSDNRYGKATMTFNNHDESLSSEKLRNGESNGVPCEQALLTV